MYRDDVKLLSKTSVYSDMNQIKNIIFPLGNVRLYHILYVSVNTGFDHNLGSMVTNKPQNVFSLRVCAITYNLNVSCREEHELPMRLFFSGT